MNTDELRLPCVVSSPRGDELVDSRWCEEPTRALSPGESESLVSAAFALAREDKYTRPTVRSMQAQCPMPPSSRRPEASHLVSLASMEGSPARTLARVRLRRVMGGASGGG